MIEPYLTDLSGKHQRFQLFHVNTVVVLCKTAILNIGMCVVFCAKYTR